MSLSATDMWITAEEIAEAALPGLPTSKRSVNRMAERAGWSAHARKRAGRGGGLEYPISVLPVEARRILVGTTVSVDDRIEAVTLVIEWMASGRSKSVAVREVARAMDASQAAIYRWVALVEGVEHSEWASRLMPPAEQARAAMQAANATKSQDMAREDGLAGMATLSEDAQQIAEGRKAALDAVIKLRQSGGLTVNAAIDIFVGSWNSDEDDFGLGAETRGLVGRVSVRSLKRWRSRYKRDGLAGFAPKHGQHRKGSGVIQNNTDVRTLIEGMLVGNPGSSVTLIMRALSAREYRGELVGEMPAYRTVQRYVDEWRKSNAALYEMASSPDGYKSKMRLVAGRADEDVLRLNQRWEMDSTPNDVILSDGKRHAIIGVIDVYTRRVRMLISRTSSSAAVAGCLRRAMLEWGVPEEVKTDNGADYISKHISRVMRGLEINQVVCPPFSPERKPHVERFFKTFQHDLVELVDGFVGHNVQQRKRIEDRKSFAKRLGSAGEEPPELLMSAEELQKFCDDWCEGIYERDHHDGIGTTPYEKSQSWTGPVRRIENERALDVLLLPVAGDSGTRTVTKRGLRIEHFYYTDPALQKYVSQRVQVRLDEEDWGRVLVLSDGGEFICWALCPERAGVSRAEYASYMSAKGREFENEARAHVRALKRDARIKAVASDVLGAAVEQASSVVSFPSGGSVAHTTDALRSAATASEMKTKSRLVERDDSAPTEADIAALDEIRAQKAKERPEPETHLQRFLRWERIDAAISDGSAMSQKESAFWRMYQRSAEFSLIRDDIKNEGRAAIFGDEQEEKSSDA